MATSDAKPTELPALGAVRPQLAVVRTTWNAELVDRLVIGVEMAVSDMGLAEPLRWTVPGCYELPLTCLRASRHEAVDALVALGVVIRGETTHFDLVSQAAASGLLQVQLSENVPIGFGVLAVENTQQALERSEADPAHNAGYDAAVAAVSVWLGDGPGT